MTARTAALAFATGAWCCVVVATLVVAVGPLAFRPVGISISGPSRLLLAAAVLVVSAAMLRGIRPLLDDLSTSTAPYVATAALTVGIVGAGVTGTGAVSVGGADSAGYLAQAHAWDRGRIRASAPLSIPGLSYSTARQSGLGFRPGPEGLAIVPIYPPGLPWIQALAVRLGGEAAAVRAVPFIAAVAAVLGAWLLARVYTHAPGAVLVAISLASLPPFLFQALQPMSDVPALAAWLLALAVARRPGGIAVAGSALATLVAILIRPNLAPLAAAVCWQARVSRTTPRRWRDVATIATGAAAGVALVAVVQQALYGSALQSGYGRAVDLFSAAHVWPNVQRYTAWLGEALSAPALAVLAFGLAGLVLHGRRLQAIGPLLLMAGLTIAVYLVYVPFDSWTYLRFVLVALAIVPIGAAMLLERGWHACPRGCRFPAFAVVSLVLIVCNLQQARALGVFDVRAREYRYEAAGLFVRDALPPSAVIVAAQHSMSASHYSGRPVLRADLLDAAALAAVSRWASQQRRPLVFVLDTAEIDMVRQRLGHDGLGALDWPPRAEVGRPVATRVWVSTDRDDYHAGRPTRTARLTGVP